MNKELDEKREAIEMFKRKYPRVIEDAEYAGQVVDGFQQGFETGYSARDTEIADLKAQLKAANRGAQTNAIINTSLTEQVLELRAALEVYSDSCSNSQLSNTQNALRNLYKAVQKSRAVNDPLGMATAMEEAGKWF